MINRILKFTLCCLLSGIVCIAAADGSNFSIGMKLLEEGKYNSLYGKDAIDSFKDAYRQTPAIGSKIAQALISYSKKLASNSKYVSKIGEDAHSVLNDALQFDGTTRDQVIELHLDYLNSLFESQDYSTAHTYCGYLYEYGAGKNAYKIIASYERKLAATATNRDYINVYECLKRSLGTSLKQKQPLIDLIADRALDIYKSISASRSFEFSKAICDLIEAKECLAFIEKRFRSALQASIAEGKKNEALKILDEIRFYLNEFYTEEDKKQLKIAIESILADYDGDYNKLYGNFKLILSLHYFDGLDFEFLANDFDLDAEVTAFSELRDPGETAYFYYDTGRIISGSRGILITDENLYFQNFMGREANVALNEINTMALTYEKGISLTGWKLRINDDENLDVRLSRIDDEAVIPFVASIIYLINLNNDLNEISLYIPESEQSILDESIWERHKGVIVTGVVVAVAATTYVLTQDSQLMQNAKQATIEVSKSLMSQAKTVLAASYRQVNAASKQARQYMTKEGLGFIKSFKTFEFKDAKGNTIKAKLSDFYDKKKIVKMPYVGGTSNSQSARGYLRDKNVFWKLYQEKGGEALSKNNLDRIAKNQAPIVDQKWVEANPNHQNFIGETLEHHHLNHGGKAIPLPQSLHRIGMNYEKWHGPKDQNPS